MNERGYQVDVYAPPEIINQGYSPRNYAGFGARFLAALIDGILLLIISAIFGIVTGVMGGLLGSTIHGPLPSMGRLFGFCLGWLYESLMLSSSHQATLGKMMMGIRVTDLYGQPISFSRATGRYFGKILSSLTLLIGYIMAAFTEKHQALHDILAGTLVLD